MEVDSFLHKVQGVLKNEQRIFGTLNSFTKENEEEISKVVEAVRKLVHHENFSEKTQRKLYVLLFLNVDSEIYNDLKKNRKLAHLVGFFPKLSRDLFMNTVLSLKLHQYAYESVAKFPSSLSYQVLQSCLNALGLIDLFEAIDFVENLILALFTKIVTINDGDEYSTHFKDLFQRLLLHYDAEKGGHLTKISSWRSSKLKHYAGLVMASLLSLLEKCTNSYCKKESYHFEGDCSLYNVQVDVNVNMTPVLGVENKYMTTKQCYEHVVAKCHENVCSITIEVWLFWVEIDLDDLPDTSNTLQRLIGKRAYTCQQSLLKAVDEFGVSSKEAEDLVTRLQNIALKPLTEEDQAKILGVDDIIKNIQDPAKDTAKWIRFLLRTPSFSVEINVLEVIKPHINLIQRDDALKLLDLLFTHILSVSGDCYHHKNLILEIVKSLSSECQKEICETFLKKFGLTEVLKQEDFQSVFIETFNKVINEEDNENELFPEFVSLALQDAEAVLSRAVEEGVSSEVRGYLMAALLGKLQVFCDTPKPQDNGKVLLFTTLEKLLLAIPTLPESHQTNFPPFVRELVIQKTLKGEHFVTDCILGNLHTHLNSKNWIVVLASLETISELFDIDCTPSCLATLALLATALQAARWSPATFTMSSVRVCELIQQLIKNFISKWFDIGYEDSAVANLVSLLEQQISPLDRYHLSRMLQKEQVPDDPALQLIYRMHYGVGKWSVLQVSQDDQHLVYSLCFVLPLLTGVEWTELFCVVAPKRAEFLCLFHIVCDSLLLCLDSAKAGGQPAVLNCLYYAIINLAEVVKCEVMSWTKDDNEYRISVLSHFCQLVSHLPKPQQERLGGSVIKVLMQLLPEGSRRKPLSAEEMTSVTTAIALLQAPLTRQALVQEFLEMIHSFS